MSYRRDPKWQADNAKVVAALEEIREALVPRSCPHEEDWRECIEDQEACPYSATKPREDVMLGSWVIMTDWFVFSEGAEERRGSLVSTRFDDAALQSNIKGLLFSALYET